VCSQRAPDRHGMRRGASGVACLKHEPGSGHPAAAVAAPTGAAA